MTPSPRISTMDQAEFPRAPQGWDYVHLTDPEKLQFDTKHYPVLIWGDYTYTALSNIHNSEKMLIVGFDVAGRIVKKVQKHGARYLWEITYDPRTGGEVVTFVGQSCNSVRVPLAELEVEENEPRVKTMDEKLFPAAPEGWKYVNLTDPEKLQFDPSHYPVLLFDGMTFTALSTIINDDHMLLLGWDANRKIVKKVEKRGARYLWQISVDASKKAVTFTGQSRASVHATLEELTPSGAPEVTTMDKSHFPPAPKGWKYTNLVDPDRLDNDPKHFPVLHYEGNTYTALSDVMNTDTMLIVGWNAQKQIVKEVKKPGARYLWRITLNLDNQSVTFTGQSRHSVDVALAQLN